jgi:hypothetical protein
MNHHLAYSFQVIIFLINFHILKISIKSFFNLKKSQNHYNASCLSHKKKRKTQGGYAEAAACAFSWRLHSIGLTIFIQ